MKVKYLYAKRIINSAGNPAIEASVATNKGIFSSSIPSGTSKGKHEVNFIGIEGSIKVIDKIKNPEINSISDIEKLEKKYEHLKANTLPLSLALLKALAAERKKEVWQLLGSKQKPLMLNKVIGGGLHAKGGPEFQEFLAVGMSNSLSKNLEAAYAVDKEVGKKLDEHGRDLEGGWVIKTDNHSALVTLQNAVDKVKSEYGFKVRLGIDVAASSFYKKDNYVYKSKSLNREKQIDFILDIIKEFKPLYVEDPLQEDDFDGFAEIKKAAKKTMICGDDLIVTNPIRLTIAKEKNSINSVIVKPNQVGYLYKLNQFIEKVKRYKYDMVISHRSQETDDDILADLGVGYGCQFMKIGLFGGERVAKINRLLKIFNE